MTLPQDIARCIGGKSKLGAPLPPCILCARRQSGGERQPYIRPPVHRENGAWVCDKRIEQ